MICLLGSVLIGNNLTSPLLLGVGAMLMIIIADYLQKYISHKKFSDEITLKT